MMLTHRILILVLWTGALVVNGQNEPQEVSYKAEMDEAKMNVESIDINVERVTTSGMGDGRQMDVLIDYGKGVMVMKPNSDDDPCLVVYGIPEQMRKSRDDERTTTMITGSDMEEVKLSLTKTVMSASRMKLPKGTEELCSSKGTEQSDIIVAKIVPETTGVREIAELRANYPFNRWWPWWGWWYWRPCFYCRYYYQWPCYRWPYWFYYWRYRFVITWA